MQMLVHKVAQKVAVIFFCMATCLDFFLYYYHSHYIYSLESV